MSLFNNWDAESTRDVITRQPMPSSPTSSYPGASFLPTSESELEDLYVGSASSITSSYSGDYISGNDLGDGLGSPFASRTFARVGESDPVGVHNSLLLPDEIDLSTPVGRWLNPLSASGIAEGHRAYPSLPAEDVSVDREEEYSLRSRYRVLVDPVVLQPRASAFPAQEDQENNPEEIDMERPMVRTCCCNCHISQSPEQKRNVINGIDLGLACLCCPLATSVKTCSSVFNWTYSK